jgi:gluconolactonase
MQNDRAVLELEVEGDELRELITGPPMAERLASGFRWVEGPIWFPEGSYLLFSEIPGNTLYRWDEEQGLTIFRRPSGFTNGNTRDLQGRLVSCEHRERRVARTESDGSITALATHYQGRRLNSPNDLVVKSDGSIYFTDPNYGLDPYEGGISEKEHDFQGVYRIDPDGSNLTLLVDSFSAPNGLAFSPDERRLYVDDSHDGFVSVFEIKADGTLGPGKRIAEGMGRDFEDQGCPDGMKTDLEGRLWVTARGGIWVLDPDGRKLGIVRMPEKTANCAWGGADRRTLYVTASTSLYRIRTNVTGAPAR